MLRRVRLSFRRRPNLPKQYDGLSSPSIKGRWNDLRSMSHEERHEVQRGAWRNAPVVSVEGIGGSRDGMFATEVARSATEESDAQEQGRSTTTTMQPSASVHFSSEVEAQQFVDDIARQEQAEANVPLMELCKAFYEDLAKNADEELDAEAMHERKSDEERRDEERSVNRDFFAQYYASQNIIPDSFQQSFVACMTSPPCAYFTVEPDTLVARHTALLQVLRLQEEEGGGAAAAFRPLPWCPNAFYHQPHSEQHVAGMKPMLEKGADSSSHRLSPPDTSPSSSSSSTPTPLLSLPNSHPNKDTVEATMSAEDLFDLDALTEGLDQGAVATHLPATVKPPIQAEEEGRATTNDRFASAAPCALPSLHQLQWLQRGISSGVIAEADMLGLLVPLLLDPQPGHLMVELQDVDGISGAGFQNGGQYGKDVLSFLRSSDLSEAELHSMALLVLHRPPANDSTQQADHRDDDDHIQSSSRNKKKRLELNERLSAIDPLALHVQTKSHWDRTPSTIRLSTTTTEGGASSSSAGSVNNDFHIDSVICAPRHSGDGIRPNVLFSSDDKALERCHANRFFDVCDGAAKRCHIVAQELQYALSLLPPRRSAEDRPSRVVFALSSMNPLECEAAVVHSLHTLAAQTSSQRRPQQDRDSAKGIEAVPHEGARYRVVPIAEALGLCSSSSGADGTAAEETEIIAGGGMVSRTPHDHRQQQHPFGPLAEGWGNGLWTWKVVDGPYRHLPDPEKYPEALRKEVARGSWRLRPSQDGCSGGFLCVVERVDVQSSLPSSSVIHPATSTFTKNEVDETRGFVLVRNGHHGGTITACTPRVQQLGTLAAAGGLPLLLQGAPVASMLSGAWLPTLTGRPYAATLLSPSYQAMMSAQLGLPLSSPSAPNDSMKEDEGHDGTRPTTTTTATNLIEMQVGLPVLLLLLYATPACSELLEQSAAYLTAATTTDASDGPPPLSSSLFWMDEALEQIQMIRQRLRHPTTTNAARNSKPCTVVWQLNVPPSTEEDDEGSSPTSTPYRLLSQVAPLVVADLQRLRIMSYPVWMEADDEAEGTRWELHWSTTVPSTVARPLAADAASALQIAATEQLIAVRDALSYVAKSMGLPSDKPSLMAMVAGLPSSPSTSDGVGEDGLSWIDDRGEGDWEQEDVTVTREARPPSEPKKLKKLRKLLTGFEDDLM